MERIHYPVFNPLDPRHNPEISTLSWNAREQRNSSSESRSPMAWVQSISRRSLHRARSGLMALRSGLRHRSSEESNTEKGFVSPVALRRERQRQGASTGAYTSETQEDRLLHQPIPKLSLLSTFRLSIRSMARSRRSPHLHLRPHSTNPQVEL